MKTLTELQATAIEGEMKEPRGAITALHIEDEQCKGWFVGLSLGAAGLRARAARPGAQAVGIPLEALLKLLREQAPELWAPPELVAEMKAKREAGNA